MDIWDRQYRVRIGKNNSVGREIGKPNEKTKRAIRCSFSCEIGDSSSSNTFTWPEPDSCDCEFVVKGRGYDEIQTVSLNFSK